jgi:hypothetical protein
MTEGCVFCDHDRLREADLYFENDWCIYASTRDPRDPPYVIPGSGGIVPKVHRASPFDLTAEEWAATRSAGTIRAGSTLTCMSSRVSMTSQWPTMASGRESKILPTGDPIRGVPAPGGTWPGHDASRGVHQPYMSRLHCG